MKNLIYVLFVIVLTSCTVAFPVVRTSSFVDFSKNDLYLSQATTADFKYTPLGIVSAFVKSGDEKTPKGKEKYSDEYSSYYGGDLQYTEMTAKDAIDLLCKAAKAKGATGILNLKLEYFAGDALGKYFGYTASGMAIKKD